MIRPKRRGDLKAWFWSKVDKTGDCWIWTHTKNSDGYGKFKEGGKWITAHRFAWTLTHGLPMAYKSSTSATTGLAATRRRFTYFSEHTRTTWQTGIARVALEGGYLVTG